MVHSERRGQERKRGEGSPRSSAFCSGFSTSTLTGGCSLVFCLQCNAGPPPSTGGWLSCSLRMDASSGQRVWLKTKPLLIFFPYLGFGTLSSGTAVQTESGVFCSLNRPLNTFSMSSMLNAQTAEPGMLYRGTAIGEPSGDKGPFTGPTSKD